MAPFTSPAVLGPSSEAPEFGFDVARDPSNGLLRLFGDLRILCLGFSVFFKLNFNVRQAVGLGFRVCFKGLFLSRSRSREPRLRQAFGKATSAHLTT